MRILGGDRLATSVAVVGGLGRIGPAPGTLASLVTVPVGVALHALGGAVAVVAALACVVVVGWWSAERYGRMTGRHDAPEVVVDEVAGMLLPLAVAGGDVVLVVTAFGLFRLLDIAKPFPISWLDARIPGGLGVMADDLAAGAVALAGTLGVGALRDGWA